MWCKAEFLLQASVSHDPSEIILMICLYADFLIIISAKKLCYHTKVWSKQDLIVRYYYFYLARTQ